MLATVEEKIFQELKNKVQRERGFNAIHYQDSHLKRRFQVRMRHYNTDSFHEYLKILEKDPQEMDVLMNTLTVNVTEFFRNPETYLEIKNKVIPTIIKNKKATGRNQIRIWSAGSSDGKEVYTLSMLFDEVLRGDNQVKITFYATDIDDVILAKAKEGFYKEIEMKGVSKSHLEKYFDHVDGGYKVKDSIRSRIRFEHRDLISDKKLDRIDLLLCRNVVIYFNSELKEKLYLDFYNSLSEGGYFIMGKTETLMGPAREKFKVFDNRERIYYKSE